MNKELKKAIKDSIKHWEKDIIKPLREGKKITRSYCFERIWKNTEERVNCYADDCPLCKIIYCDNCELCPLSDLEMCCEESGSPWHKFIKKPNLTTAKNMVKALQKCLEVV